MVLFKIPEENPWPFIWESPPVLLMENNFASDIDILCYIYSQSPQRVEAWSQSMKTPQLQCRAQNIHGHIERQSPAHGECAPHKEWDWSWTSPPLTFVHLTNWRLSMVRCTVSLASDYLRYKIDGERRSVDILNFFFTLGSLSSLIVHGKL